MGSEELERAHALVVYARSRRCAFRLRDVREILRPLPLEPVASTSPFLLGVTVLRGEPVPTIDLGLLLGLDEPRATTRFVSLRVGTRSVALAVEAVAGVQPLDLAHRDLTPPLMRDAAGAAISQLQRLDREFVTLIEAARLLPENFAVAQPGG